MPEGEKKKKPIVWIVVAIVVGVIVLCCGGGGIIAAVSDDPTVEVEETTESESASEEAPQEKKKSEEPKDEKPSEPAEPQEEPSPAGTEENPAPRGTAVENKSARYKVLDVQVRKNTGGPFGEDAAGQFVIVKLAVTNVKDETIQFSSSDLTLIVDGTEIEADDATIFLDDGFAYDDISPGLTKEGSVAFDVAPQNAGKGVLKAQAIFSMDEAVYLSVQ
ncbi:DUF4352 domain-containing protein [Nocardioides panacisoli]|uniref:DUF4352 domain-containing protein n=1 Tax=Nocardioides panacisoli TaxID=627624 RepID=UPI001C62F9C9|nr:DUF4352 domain-containing protein [Nocardioides panacisoli]QYJ03485.1 DUF4352 domain-containing protein [Nocardioides panacisoli]